MPITRLIRPAYAENFRCIGSNCEETCCKGWSVPVDKAAHEKFQGLPESPLRALIHASVLLAPKDAKPEDGFGKTGFAKLVMNASNECPLLSPERLCRVHGECGEEFLPHTCATYPRIVHSLGGYQEKALAFSCPEAARVVLLDPNLSVPTARHAAAAAADSIDSGEGRPWLPPYFWPIRDAAIELVRNRAYPLWQRLFLLGIFSQRLDAIAAGQLDRSVPQFLRDFDATVSRGSLQRMMEAQPIDHAAQLDVVLRLAGLMLQRSNVTARFGECIHAFTTGIGNGPGATFEKLTAEYTHVHDRYFAPFFARHAHILENYLINTILRCQFPFGTEGMKEGAVPTMTREFAQLTAQFALTKGLLIGVAGFHRESFSVDHVVHTAQAASKHFEHHPEFLKLAFELLAESKMDGARGTAILLRNAEPLAQKQASREKYAQEPYAGIGRAVFPATSSKGQAIRRSGPAPRPTGA
jgi:lysine-N-methylase